ncbi:hypothetical protein C8J56DRAFT_1045349 [Mycena floridula]|nr:hypothetical protein C8J56DRAFT_1045349 [Mycena floridula]
MSLNPALYSGIHNDLSVQSVTSLPAYTPRPSRPSSAHRRREPIEHVLELSDKRGKPWASLKLFSNAGGSKSLPTFVQGDKITGSVSLELSEEDSISSIDISVSFIRGTFVPRLGPIVKGNAFCGTASPGDDTGQFKFLDQGFTLWSKDMGDPRQPGSSSGQRYSGKLSGSYSWPFSFELPQEVFVSATSSSFDGDDTVTSYPPPPSLLEKDCIATITYTLVVDFRRGKFRSDSRIQSMIVYVPATRPEPPSRLRQLAYQEHSPLLGPDADPEGWTSPQHIIVRGTIFSSRNIQLSCKLCLATPLAYTRGTAIPLSLSIRSTDRQGLDLLSNPKAIKVKLSRALDLHDQRSHHLNSTARGDVKALNSWTHTLPKHDITDIGLANWWPSEEGAQANDDDERIFSGEILLPKALKPSCAISHLKLYYTVSLMPFEVVGFVSSATTTPLLEQRVEIVTTFAKGPRPLVYSPPNYDA